MLASKVLIAGYLVFASHITFADAQKNNSPPAADKPGAVSKIVETAKENIEATIKVATHPYLYGGFDLGVGSVKSQEKGETNMKGSYRAIRGNASFYFERFTLQGGGGYFMTSLEGEDEARKYRQKASVSTAFLDGAVRFRFGAEKSFELGFTNQIFYGSQSDFGPVEGANDKNYFYGVSATFQPPVYRNWRIEFQFLTDYTIKTRQVSFISLGLQYGFPLISI